MKTLGRGVRRISVYQFPFHSTHFSPFCSRPVLLSPTVELHRIEKKNKQKTIFLGLMQQFRHIMLCLKTKYNRMEGENSVRLVIGRKQTKHFFWHSCWVIFLGKTIDLDMPDTRCHRPGLEYTFNKLLGKHKYKINLGWYQKVCGFFFSRLAKTLFFLEKFIFF